MKDMFDKLLTDLLEGFGRLDLKDAVKFISEAPDRNITIKEVGETAYVTTNKEMNDDEYKEYLDGVLSTWKTMANFISDYNLVVHVKAGSRPEEVYEYDEEKEDFVLTGAQNAPADAVGGRFEPYVAPKTENKGLIDLEKYKEGIKDLLSKYSYSNTEPEKEDQEEIKDAPLSFAQDLKAKIGKELMEEFETPLFDVDYAIEKMKAIFEDGSYDIIWKDNKIDGIAVPIEYLSDEFDGTCDDAETVLEEESDYVFLFVNRCINELGFSNVIPDYNEVEEGYTSVNFKFYF